MRKLLLLALIATATISFKFSDAVKSNTAEVNQYQGIYVFADSKPAREYDYLGSVKYSMTLTGSGQYADVRDKLVKKVKKEYPAAEAIIIKFNDGGSDVADAIKFK